MKNEGRRGEKGGKRTLALKYVCVCVCAVFQLYFLKCRFKKGVEKKGGFFVSNISKK